MSNQNGNETKITSRLSTAKSVISAISTFAVCVVLFFVLQNQLGGYKYISQVKKGHPFDYPQISYEEAFGAFYTSPQWTYQELPDKGKIVKFTGVCQQNGKPASVELIYKLDEAENSFSLIDGKVNGTQFSILTIAEFNNRPFEEYKH